MDYKISQDILLQLSNHGYTQNYSPNELIVSKGAIVTQSAFLLEGLVKVTMNEKKNALLLYHINDFNHGIISFMNIYENIPIQIAIKTIRNTTLLWVPNEVLIKLSSVNLELKHAIMASYHHNNHHLLKTLHYILEKPIIERLFSYLITKSVLYKTKKLQVSKTEIASDLNISKNTVYTILKQLEDQHLISRYPNTVILEKINATTF